MPAYIVELLFQRQAVETGKWQGQKKTDSAVQDEESLTISALNFALAPNDRCWIRYRPMAGNRFTRPYWADLAGGVVTDGKYEVKLGSIG